MPAASTAVQETTQDRYQHVEETSKQGRKLRITAKVRSAIDLMVWSGLKRDEAATKAGLKDNSLYVALARPDVKAYYLRQLDVLRTSERARNIHTLTDVRDQNSNQMARVQAVKALEQISDDQASNPVHRAAPGMVVVVVGQSNQGLDGVINRPALDRPMEISMSSDE